MSKTSAKARYSQLMEWLKTYKSSPKHKDKNNKNPRKQSRMSYYKKKGIR